MSAVIVVGWIGGVIGLIGLSFWRARWANSGRAAFFLLRDLVDLEPFHTTR
jgi:hypothetical protein